MPALTIYLIRHGEKPGGQWPGPGIDENGCPDKKSLVVRGWQRAGAWAVLFAAATADGISKPALIYAAKPEIDGNGTDPSKRPYETVVPTSLRLGIDINSQYSKGQETDLATAVKNQSGVVLVCWEHKTIVENLIPALTGAENADGIPSDWDNTRFDVVLRFVRDEPTAAWSFSQLFPKLLSGDTDVPL